MTKLVAKERFFYAGRNVEAEEEFDAQEQDVALLTNSISPRARLAADKAKAELPAAYETRSMEFGEASAPDPSFGKPRRYNRRDMRAKE